MYKCKFCGKELEKAPSLGGHIVRCKLNPKNQQVINCQFCHKKYSQISINRHEKYCCENPNHEVFGENSNFNAIKDKLFCQYCNRPCINLNSLKQHEIRCKENPHRILQNNIVKYHQQIQSGEKSSWNKGLTKDICTSIKKGSETLIKNYQLGLNHIGQKGLENPATRPEVRQKISAGMRKAHAEGRAHVWNERQGRHASYPELWLEDVLKNNFNLVKDVDYIREKPYHGLFLDFFFEQKQLVIEIDGSQHYIHGYLDSDRRKDSLLHQENILLIRCPWEAIQKDKQLWINLIEQFIFKDSMNISKENKIFIETYRQQFL